jgi:beta-xylosidase
MNNEKAIRNTYCNPTSLPDYPRGKLCVGEDGQKDFRETADPSVIYYDNKWYLYPSAGMVYYSEDFITWKHKKMEPYDPGYAPTVVYHNNKFYLTACDAPLYVSDSPLGPFKEIGYFIKKDGTTFKMMDPMLFSDDDGRLYVYWGISGKDPGILGAELDNNSPWKLITEPEILIKYNPDHEWETFSEWHEDSAIRYLEGSWMVKVNGKYYLTYAAPGTQWSTYAMGAYVSDKPLSGFSYQQKTQSFINGMEL